MSKVIKVNEQGNLNNPKDCWEVYIKIEDVFKFQQMDNGFTIITFKHDTKQHGHGLKSETMIIIESAEELKKLIEGHTMEATK